MAGLSTARCPKRWVHEDVPTWTGEVCLGEGAFWVICPWKSRQESCASKTLRESPLAAVKLPEQQKWNEFLTPIGQFCLHFGSPRTCAPAHLARGQVWVAVASGMAASVWDPTRARLYQFGGPLAEGTFYAHFLGCCDVFRPPRETLASPGSLSPGPSCQSHTADAQGLLLATHPDLASICLLPHPSRPASAL